MSVVNLDQHYLADTGVIEIITRYIIGHTGIDAPLIEIGSGKGSLTQPLLDDLRSVIALELDPDNCRELEALKTKYQLLQIYQTDALSWLKESKEDDPNVLKYVIGNIPYSIAEPLLHLFFSKIVNPELYLLLPESFVDGFVSRGLGAAYYQINHRLQISAGAFEPYADTKHVFVHLSSLNYDYKDFTVFIRRWCYEHEDTMLHNTLTKAVDWYIHTILNQVITKNQCRDIVDKILVRHQDWADRTPRSITGIYEFLSECVLPAI